MEKTLNAMCKHCNNYFLDFIYVGKFSITNGCINGAPELLDGQYFRIVGSVFNDGVYTYPDGGLKDEPEFSGAVWIMKIPQDFINLATEIDAWCEKYSDVQTSPFTSESFGGYSYTKATGSDGDGVSWQDVFASRLNQYRRKKALPYANR
jgi:hypothetical protein